jgi:uncharacterized protein YndB with AHSA1/START domain
MAGIVSVKRIIDAPVERTWQAWTVADELKQWFSVREKMEVVEFDVRPGGKVRLEFPGSTGPYTWTYIKIHKPHELVFDILDFSLPDYPDGIGGVCHVDFKAVGNKTEVTVWGELEDESLRDKYQDMLNGWNGTLDDLNNFLISKET